MANKTILDTSLFKIIKSNRSLDLYCQVTRTKKDTGEEYLDWEFQGYYGRLEFLAKRLLEFEITRDGTVIELDGLQKEVQKAQARILKAIEEAIHA